MYVVLYLCISYVLRIAVFMIASWLSANLDMVSHGSFWVFLLVVQVLIVVMATRLALAMVQRYKPIQDEHSFIQMSVRWFLLIVGGWLIIRDILFSSIQGMPIPRHPLDELGSLIVSLVIFTLITWLWLHGWKKSLSRFSAKIQILWRSFYLTWLH